MGLAFHFHFYQTHPGRHLAPCSVSEDVQRSDLNRQLELHKIYRVIPDKIAQANGDLRIIDESGEDYLFPADYFLPIPLPQTIIRALNKSFARTSAQN